MTQRGAEVAIVDGDRVREHRVYYDQFEPVEQLGVPIATAG